MHKDLSIAKINSVFDKIEQEIPVASWEMGGLKIWPLIRNNHWFYLMSQKVFNPNNQIASYANPLRRLRQIFDVSTDLIRAQKKDKKNNDKIREADILITVASSTRFFKINDDWYSPYSDSLIKHFRDENLNTLVLEFASDGQCLFPRFAPSIYVQNKSFYLSFLAKFRGKINLLGLEEKLEGWDDFLAIIKNELGADCCPSIDAVRTKAWQVLLHEQWFKQMLQKIKPKVAIIGFAYCSADAMGLIRACRQLGILSIEIQHGVQGEEQIGYRQWAQLPEQGYDTLPEIFWTWGEDEKNTIESWAKTRPNAHRAIVGGNPCLHIYDKNGSRYSHLGLSALEKTDQQSFNVLFTAQAFDRLPSFLIEAIHQTPNWKWWIRIHPQYWEMEEPINNQLVSNNLLNANISTATQLPLVRLLEQSDVHVTEFSSSILEAKSCGVCSVVINPMGVGLFKELIDSEEVLYANSTELLISAIKQQVKKKVQIVRTENDSCFFPDIMNEIKKRAHCLG